MGRTLQNWLDLIYDKLGSGEGVYLASNGETVDVQHPLPTDGDSVYAKDIDLTRSILNGFSGTITDLFDNSASIITELSATNPKSYTVYFKRPLTTSEITVAAGQTGNFSNMKLYLYDIAGNELLSIDNSTDNTKYTKYVFNNVPQTFIGYKIEFHTADAISVAFNYIHKSIDVQANLKMVDLDSGLLSDAKGHENAQMVVTHKELLSEGHIATTRLATVIGGDNSIGSTFEILSSQLFVQPATEVPMEIVSSDADDAVGGTGIEKVEIIYFDNAEPWVQTTIIVDMNGTTPVPLPNIDTYRIQSMTGVGGTAVGDITLQNIGGGTTYGSIDQDNSIMERCVYYVRAGYRIVVTDIILGCTTGGGILWRLFATNVTAGNVTTPIGRLSVRSADTTFGHPLSIGFTISNPDGLRLAIGIAAKGKVVNQEGTASLRVYEEPIVS